MHRIRHSAFRGLAFGLIVAALWLPNWGAAMVVLGFQHLLSQDNG